MEKLFIICEIVSVVFMCICIIFYFEELRRYYRRYIGILNIYLSLIGICMLFIAFLYGFHSDIFSIHDKSLSEQNSYNWFNLNDVYRFPIDQLRLNKERTPFKNFPISYSSQNEDTLSHLILFDATLSCRETTAYKDILKSNKEEFKVALGKTCLDFNDSLNHFGQLLFIRTINKTLKLPKTSLISAGFYYGDKKCKMLGSQFKEINTIDECSLIKEGGKWSNGFLIQKRDGQKTDYNELILDINDRLLSNEQFPKGSFNKKVLTLIGDFYHEKNSESDFEELSNGLLKLRNTLEISQINLIIIPNGVKDSEKVVNRTIELFRKNFSDILNYTKLNSSDLSGDGLKLFDFITTFTQKSDNSSIVLYNPYSVFNRNEKAIGELRFENAKVNDEIFLCLKSDSQIEEIPFSFSFNNSKFFYNKPFISKNQEFNLLEITGINSENNNLYLEYHKTNSNFKLKVPIIIRERLSETTSLSLIFFYSILYTCTFIICITFFLITKRVAGKRNRQGSWTKTGIEYLALTITAVAGIITLSVIYFTTIVQGIENLVSDNFWGMVACCCPIIFLWILFFRYGKVKLLLKYIFN